MLLVEELETAVLRASCAEREWPAQVAAGIYAGVDFVIDQPASALEIVAESNLEPASRRHYERLLGRLAGFIGVNAPNGSRPPGSVDEALVAGIVGLVGDHLRFGRLDRLAELRPELVLLTLLPYLGLTEAQAWANRAAGAETG